MAHKATVYGYARVSTDKQEGQRQIDDILAYCKKHGLGAPKIIQETASGAKDRPELAELLDGLGQGDTLLVTEFSRLTRKGVPELLQIARAVTSVGAVLTEIVSGTKYDNTAIGELLIAFTATVDRMERERIGERTKSALQMRKARGMKLGRPTGGSVLDQHKNDILKYQELGMTKSQIAAPHRQKTSTKQPPVAEGKQRRATFLSAERLTKNFLFFC
jgi:DNA invertase Pin-like site-specific DNA recombinase